MRETGLRSSRIGVRQMEEKKDRMDRRGFLSSVVKAAALVTAGAAIMSGGCKCGDEDVDWSDEGDDEQQPPPKKKDEGEGGEKKDKTPKSNAGS